MTSKSKASIKAFFTTGSKPTQAQFIDFIDSYVDSSGPVGALEAAASAGAQGFAFVSGGHCEVLSGANALSFMGATVVTTAQASAATQNVIDALVASTAQANAGTDNATLMNPVLVKNAIASLGASEVVLISSATASNSATLDFTTGISTAYSQFIFVIENISNATASQALLCQTSRSSTFQTANYHWGINKLNDQGTSTLTGSNGDTSIHITTNSGNGSSGQNLNGTLTFDALANASERHTCIFNVVYKDDTAGGTSMATGFGSDENGVTAVDGVRFKFATGNIASGKIYMYGVKNT